MNEDDEILSGLIEADETYVGGSMTNMHDNYKSEKSFYPDGMEHKAPVLGMVERKGKIKVQVISRANKKTIQPIMKAAISKESEIVTDGFGATQS